MTRDMWILALSTASFCSAVGGVALVLIVAIGAWRKAIAPAQMQHRAYGGPFAEFFAGPGEARMALKFAIGAAILALVSATAGFAATVVSLLWN